MTGLPQRERGRGGTFRWFVRIALICLSVVFIVAGGLYLVNGISSQGLRFDSSFKFGIAAFGFGLFFLFAAIRGKRM